MKNRVVYCELAIEILNVWRGSRDGGAATGGNSPSVVVRMRHVRCQRNRHGNAMPLSGIEFAITRIKVLRIHRINEIISSKRRASATTATGGCEIAKFAIPVLVVFPADFSQDSAPFVSAAIPSIRAR